MLDKKYLYLMILSSGLLYIFLATAIVYKPSYSYLDKSQQDEYEKLIDKKTKIMQKYNITENELDPKKYLDIIKKYGLTLKERTVFTDLLFLEIQEEDTSICGNLGLKKFEDMKYCKLLEELKGQ